MWSFLEKIFSQYEQLQLFSLWHLPMCFAKYFLKRIDLFFSSEQWKNGENINWHGSWELIISKSSLKWELIISVFPDE